MVSFGNGSIKKEAFSLWTQTFRDPSEYVEYYFNSRYKHENFLCYLKESTVSCGVHFNPYNISYLNTNLSGRFLVAAATFSQYKDRGLFSEVLYFAFDHFLKKGTDIIFLIPANSAIYSKHSFSLSHYLKEYSISFSELKSFKISKDIEITEVSSENFSIYKEFILNEYKSFSSYIDKIDEDFKNYIEEVKIDGGHTYIVSCNDVTTGAFSYFISGDDIVVKQLFFKTSKEFLSILGFVNNFSNYYKEVKIITDSYSELEYFFPNLKKVSINERPFLMTRILNGKKIIETFFSHYFNSGLCSESFEFFINLKDNRIKDNNFLISICNKKGTDTLSYSYLFNQEMENCSDISHCLNSKSGISLNISDLVSLIFGATTCNALVKRGGITLHNIDTSSLESIFNIKRGYIHEEV